MALPRQVGIEISYDGTAKQAVTTTTTSTQQGGGSSYTVVSGDCLWNIAKRFLGAGNRYMEIYNANEDVIESTAKAHGKSNSWNGSTKGWWIWPGEVLTIPGETQTVTQETTSIQTVGESNPSLGKKIEAQITALSYSDIASGQSDSVSITMHDIGKEWMNAYMPKRGADLSAKINLRNWDGDKSVNCGTFILDDISFSGKPTTCVLGGVSVPTMDDFKSLQRTNTFQNTTVQDIASQIAARAGVALHYEADTFQVNEIEQNRQTDSAFLLSLCEKYGLSLKVYNQKIVIFDTVKYEEKSAVCTLQETDCLRWSYNTTIEGTYTGVDLNYTDPDTDETINITMGEKGRVYSINTQADNRYDAELQAAAKANEANRSIETMEISIKANPSIVASQCIQIFGLGKIDGKYFIDKVKHSISGSGYTMALSLHKVQTPIKVTVPAVSGGSKEYNVGDIVNYHGGTHYYTSYPDAKGYSAKAGKAKITKKNGKGKAHPWHLIHIDSGSNVYGWVDDGTFD